MVHVPTLARMFSVMEAALPVTSHDDASMDGNEALSGQSMQKSQKDINADKTNAEESTLVD